MKSKDTAPDRFRLNSDDCELLIAFAEGGHLAGLASRLGRDVSVVSRQMKRLAERAPVLEKISGRWKLTRAGEELTHWAREAIRAQAGLLDEVPRISIATTHEFGARILAPALASLLGTERTFPSIYCSDVSIEPMILGGQAELGFDCGRPESPLIKYKLVRKEPLCLVATPEFCKRFRIRGWAKFLETPYVEYTRISPTRSLGLKHEIPLRAGSFNTVASARAAVIGGFGWSLLPQYAVSSELRNSTLRAFVPETTAHEQFGVWWLRGSAHTERVWVPRAIDWLGVQDLG